MKSLIAGALALSLGACTTAFTIPGTSITIDPTTVNADVKALCAANVEVQDIAALLSSAPWIGTAEGVAAIICQAITSAVVVTPSAAAYRGAPRHGVVVVNGHALRFSRR